MKKGTKVKGTHKYMLPAPVRIGEDEEGKPIFKYQEEQPIKGKVKEVREDLLHGIGVENEEDNNVYWFPKWGLQEVK